GRLRQNNARSGNSRPQKLRSRAAPPRFCRLASTMHQPSSLVSKHPPRKARVLLRACRTAGRLTLASTKTSPARILLSFRSPNSLTYRDDIGCKRSAHLSSQFAADRAPRSDVSYGTTEFRK